MLCRTDFATKRNFSGNGYDVHAHQCVCVCVFTSGSLHLCELILTRFVLLTFASPLRLTTTHRNSLRSLYKCQAAVSDGDNKSDSNGVDQNTIFIGYETTNRNMALFWVRPLSKHLDVGHVLSSVTRVTCFAFTHLFKITQLRNASAERTALSSTLCPTTTQQTPFNSPYLSN